MKQYNYNIILKQLNKRPIAYYPIYRKITGSTTAGILLSQLMYWFSKKDKFYKTDEEVKNETLLTEKELKNAKKKIKELPFIKITREGIPAKTYYKIDWDIYVNFLINFENQDNTKKDFTDCPKGPNLNSQKGQTITKTTTKITSNKKYESTNLNEENNSTIDDLTNYIISNLSSKGYKTISTSAFKYNRALLSIKKYYSLDDIQEVIEYCFLNDKHISTIANPSFLQNNFENIYFAYKKQKEKDENENRGWRL